MILGFSTNFPADKGKIANKPTCFIELIMNSLLRNGLAEFSEINDFEDNYSKKFGDDLVMVPNQKLHTIRKDSKNRWKAGNDIHFCINVRTKNQFQFAPIVKCISTQEIEIQDKNVWIDGLKCTWDEIEVLAINDGFDSVDAFFEYFNTGFTGKIIHWTNLKY